MIFQIHRISTTRANRTAKIMLQANVSVKLYKIYITAAVAKAMIEKYRWSITQKRFLKSSQFISEFKISKSPIYFLSTESQ